MTQQFFIKSVNTQNGPYAINVTGGATENNTPVILSPQCPQTALMSRYRNAVWEIIPGGVIVSADDRTKVLTPLLSPGQTIGQSAPVVIDTRIPGDASQEWEVISAGVKGTPEQCVLVNKASISAGTPMGLNIQYGVLGPTTPIITWSLGSGAPTWNMIFELVPVWGPPNQWTSIKSLAAPNGSELALQMPMIAGGWEPASSVAQVGPCSGFGHNSTWQLTENNTLQLGWNTDLLLTAGVDSNNNLTGDVYIFPVSTSGTILPSQQWIVPESGVIVVSTDVTQALTAGTHGTPLSAGTGVTLTPYTPGSPTPNQLWDCFTTVLLQTVLVQGQASFPQAQTGTTQLLAYQAIDAALWPSKTFNLPGGSRSFTFGQPSGGLRGQYTNLAAPLASYLAQILAMRLPKGVKSDDWKAVVPQLIEELTAAIAVQSFFAQMTTYAIELNLAQSEALIDIAALCTINAETKIKTKFNWHQCVMGIVYTLLNIAGTLEGDPDASKQAKAAFKLLKYGAPALANVMQTAFNSVQTKGEQTNPPAEGLNEFQDLQQALVETFAAITEELGLMGTAVLSEWNKLQTFYRMTCMPEGGASLFWSSTAAPALARKSLSGYLMQVLQTLVPTISKQSNSSSSFNFVAAGSSGPQAGLSKDGTIYTQYNTPFQVSNNDAPVSGDAGSYNSYTSSLDEKLLQYIWTSGAVPFAFFHQLGGWSLSTRVTNIDAGVICELRNCTPEPYLLFIESTGVNGQNENGTNGAWVEIPPYGVVNFDCVAEKNTRFQFPITVYSGTAPGGAVLFNAEINTDPSMWSYYFNQDPPANYQVKIASNAGIAPMT